MHCQNSIRIGYASASAWYLVSAGCCIVAVLVILWSCGTIAVLGCMLAEAHANISAIYSWTLQQLWQYWRPTQIHSSFPTTSLNTGDRHRTFGQCVVREPALTAVQLFPFICCLCGPMRVSCHDPNQTIHNAESSITSLPVLKAQHSVATIAF